MKRKNHTAAISAALALVLLLITALSGCGGSSGKAAAVEPTYVADPIITAEPAEPAEAAAESGRQDGERFESVIMLEGFEMDYDYESFARQSGAESERLVSIYDRPENPENYLEVTYSAQDADTAAAAVSEALSHEYDIIMEAFQLDRAGSCIRIDASNARGNGGTPDRLQMVYIIPAGDGCRIAAAHYSFESAEGFGRRFQYMLNTLEVMESRRENGLTGTWQTASVGYEADGTMQPEYYVCFTDTEILYGHMKDGAFVLDHSDRIVRFEKTAAGGYRVQAEASNGVQYTYQTCESDDAVLEYYETWQEEAFAETYRGGASLSRSS